MASEPTSEAGPAELAARCHEIQVGLGSLEVPEFERLSEVGMAVRLALHIRGLPLVKYEVLRLVAVHFLHIPSLAVKRIVRLLAEVDFAHIRSEGNTIKGVLPKVPYYQDLYSTLGDYARIVGPFNEAESLTVEIVRRLAGSPENLDSLRNSLGADAQLFRRVVSIGEDGSYLIRRRSRGRDILLNPSYFSENADLFSDIVASKGAETVRRIVTALRSMQGIPLSVVESGG